VRQFNISTLNRISTKEERGKVTRPYNLSRSPKSTGSDGYQGKRGKRKPDSFFEGKERGSCLVPIVRLRNNVKENSQRGSIDTPQHADESRGNQGAVSLPVFGRGSPPIRDLKSAKA